MLIVLELILGYNQLDYLCLDLGSPLSYINQEKVSIDDSL